MITNLSVDNFLGVASIAAPLSKTVLIAGPNAAGKSSIAHAIRLALGGELARITLKKQAGSLVKTGAKSASIKLAGDGFTNEVKIMASGGMQGVPKEVSQALQCALDQTRFINLPADKRRELLFSMVAWPGLADIVKRMAKRGCDDAMIEQVSPMLMGLTGFSAAIKYAEEKQAEARKEWVTITGETYGEAKAETWQAPCVMPEPSVKMLQADIDAMDKELMSVMQEIATLKARSDAPRTMACPACGAHLVYASGSLEKAQGRSQEPVSTSSRMTDLNEQQKDIVKRKNATHVAMAQATEAERLAGQSVAITQAAMTEHQAVIAWGRLRDAMSPAGIPSELIYELLNSLNLDMAQMSERAGFKRPVSLDENMEPSIGSTPYALASESEKWRMQALIALALANKDDAGTVVWDGMDIIEPASRQGIITLAKEAKPQVIMAATLKAKPEIPGVTSIWMGA